MDTIGNLLTSIRNAEMAGHASVSVPSSRLSQAVCEKLQVAGVVTGVTTVEATPRARLELTLKPGVQHHLRRISTPGRRLYTDVARIPRVRQGFGTVLISTPKGVLTGSEARKARVGGELICEIYEK